MTHRPLFVFPKQRTTAAKQAQERMERREIKEWTDDRSGNVRISVLLTMAGDQSAEDGKEFIWDSNQVAVAEFNGKDSGICEASHGAPEISKCGGKREGER